MNILVYQREEDGYKCPKCGENVNLDLDIFRNILKNNQVGLLKGFKSLLENIINSNDIIEIKNQIQIVKLVIYNLIIEYEKYINNIKNLINTYNKKQNIIKGIIEIDNNKDTYLFNEYYMKIKEGIDVYINKRQINTNVIKSNIINGNGNYEFKIIFNNNNIMNLCGFFENCSNIIYLDLSNFNTSKVIDMSFMFSDCHKLKEIKGINKFNTSNVIKMNSMFQECNELQKLDLTSFDNSKVINMSFMFNKCYKLKEIKGLNKFNTNQVFNISSMFNNCYELEHLDLSSFNTSKVGSMQYMFNKCKKLKEIKGINNFDIKQVRNMKSMLQECKKLKNIDSIKFKNILEK